MRRKHRVWSLLTAVTVAGVSVQQAEAQLFQGQFGAGNTWNLYELVTDPLQWSAAQADAAGRTQYGVKGNLVSIHSDDENAFVAVVAGGGDSWIGLTDREGAAPQVTNNGKPAPQESNDLDDFERQGWAWTSGEPFTYTKWGSGEPNNWDGNAAGAADAGIEDAAHMRGDAFWNDAAIGFGLIEPKVPTIIPNSSLDESNGPSFKYVVEYNTKAASAFAGVDFAPTTFPKQRLGGPKGTAGNWGVVDYRGDWTAQEPARNVISQIQDIQSGELPSEKTEGQLPWLNVTDPQTNANGGPVLSNALGNGMFPYLADTDADDNDIISLAHARIKVAEAGKYTFNVHSDDGFAMRIFNAQFSKSAGNGTIDAVSKDTLVHPGNTGDANTQAVVDLAAGEYNIEFMSWERGGGAFYELTAAKGDFVTSGAETKRPQWLAVGDPRVLDERIQPPGGGGIGKLTKPLTIVNVNNITPGDGLEALRETVLDAGDGDAKSTDGRVFVLDDHNVSSTGCPFGNFPHDGDVVRFPNTAGDLNNFATGVYGAFVIDDGDGTVGETLDVTVHIDSDDRGMFRVKGQSFSEVSGQQLYDIGGDQVMFGDVDTCNTNFSGLITLKEGVNYDFEAFHVENGGDSGFQVLFAAGNQLDNPDPNLFKALRLPGGANLVFARNPGFTLVAEVDGLKGDFNGNGQLDAGDLDDMAGKTDAKYDVNADGQVNYGDRQFWVASLKKTWIGDTNLDGLFNSTDFVIVFQKGKFETGGSALWDEGDWNGDKQFNTSDFVAAFQDGGYDAGIRAGVSAVPEPSSLVLVGLGFAGLLGSLRKRK